MYVRFSLIVCKITPHLYVRFSSNVCKIVFKVCKKNGHFLKNQARVWFLKWQKS